MITNDTKSLILATALALYNEQGFSLTSLRDIAKKMNISPGNLTYHFKQNEDIILILIQQFLEKVTCIIEEIKSSSLETVDTLYNYIHNLFCCFYDYKFLFINFVDISKKYAKLKNIYGEVFEIRKREYYALFKGFQEKGVFIADISEPVIKCLIEQMFILGDSFIVHNELTKHLNKDETVSYYSKLFINQFYFVLTDTHKRVYMF